MCKKIIKKLKAKGVVFEPGLKDKDLKEIEYRYNIHFPEELKRLFTYALPISEGFYNWRDFSPENVGLINFAIETPYLGIKGNIEEILWNNQWGREPENMIVRNDIILSKMQNAPKLIPLYKHRYLSGLYDYDNPVFSICDADIIYYGRNLAEYFDREFSNKIYSVIPYDEVKFVDFWSDLI